jgi:hypothetical protein
MFCVPRGCRDKVATHKYVQRLCTAATNSCFWRILSQFPAIVSDEGRRFRPGALPCKVLCHAARSSLRLRFEGMNGSIPLALALASQATHWYVSPICQ